MAGSRLEKFGSIYRRVTGLLRSGALKREDRPMWLDVYEAFPPKRDPVFTESEPQEPVIHNIMYAEDMLRARFYKVYGNPDVIDLANHRTKSVCQRFVERYQELQSSGSVSEANLFQATTDDLKATGIRLLTTEQLEKERSSRMSSMRSSGTSHHTRKSPSSVHDSVDSSMSAAKVFGGIAREVHDDEDWIEEPEDLSRDPFDKDR